MPADKTVDFVVMFVVFGMLAAGIASVVLGFVVRTYDRLMSNRELTVPDKWITTTEHRSEPVEQHGDGAELPSGTTFGTVVNYLEHCDDDALLDILAQLADAEGDYRFAESRVAKFIPGRVEDRLAQVRAVRDTTPPPPPGRQLRVRDEAGERVISMEGR